MILENGRIYKPNILGGNTNRMGMFDDLIHKREREPKDEFECWFCGCKEFEFEGVGIFISKVRLKQKVSCNGCGKEHTIIYDNELNIIDIYPED